MTAYHQLSEVIISSPQGTETAKPFVSLVIPAYNEEAILEANLHTLCEYMESLEHTFGWEMIIVDDGSTDETANVAESFASKRENVYVLHHPYNFRLGQALRTAFSNCHGDYVVTMDVDLSYSPDHIGRMLAKLVSTRAKIVIASPYMKDGKVSNVPWLRRMMSQWANRFLSFTVTRDLFSDRLTTLTGMVRAYDREFLSRLNLKAMDVDINPEIVYKAMILRARIVEIPAHLNWRPGKTSGMLRRSSMRILKGIISSLVSGFMFRPFMFFVLPGLLLMMASLYPLAWVVIHVLTQYSSLPSSANSFDYRLSDAVAAAFHQSPHAFIVGGLSFIVAIQLISFGMLALQSKRYFEELFHLGSCTQLVRKAPALPPTPPQA